MTASKEDISFLFEDNKSPLSKFPVKHLFSTYKWVLIPVFPGVAFLVLALFVILHLPHDNSDVVFNNLATASGEISIHVDVEGEVENPGLYSLKNGSRVEEALVKAGGFSANADRNWAAKRLNRAKVLTDGDKIYIPSTQEINNSQPFEKTQGKQITDKTEAETIGDVAGVFAKVININSATEAELDTLPGVGAVTSKKIASGRPYDTIDDLIKKKIVGQSLFEKIKDLIVAD